METHTILLIVSAAYLAFILWLVVRFINRRERWTKYTVSGLVGLPALYIVSFGPACWIASRTESETLPRCYLPILYAEILYGDENVLKLAGWYAGIGLPRAGAVNFPLVQANDVGGYCIRNSDAEMGEFTVYRVQGRWTLLDLLGHKRRVVPESAVGGSSIAH
jgi:hypothetical protein